MKKPAFLLTALILIFSASAYAQEAELDLDALVKSALEKNPKIKSLEDAARASKFRIRPAGALPDPVIGLGLKNMGLTRWTVGEEVMSEVGVSVSQMIPFPGKLSLKSRIASTQALQAEEDLKAATSDLSGKSKSSMPGFSIIRGRSGFSGKRKKCSRRPSTSPRSDIRSHGSPARYLQGEG